MILSDYHIHTSFSDGQNTPEEMVQAAIEKGMKAIGFSDHSYTYFDESYCMKKEKIQEYKDTIHSLKMKYQGKIRVLCGIEQDFYSRESVAGYDFVIGSVHYIRVKDQFIPVDESPEILQEAALLYFDGDIYRLIELYFKTVSNVVEKTNCDIIGHVDLIQKFNEGRSLFGDKNTRYQEASIAAVRALLEHKKLFELNTGAISRGYLSSPYPSPDLLRYIRKNGGKLILGSDAHNADSIGFQFQKYVNMI